MKYNNLLNSKKREIFILDCLFSRKRNGIFPFFILDWQRESKYCLPTNWFSVCTRIGHSCLSVFVENMEKKFELHLVCMLHLVLCKHYIILQAVVVADHLGKNLCQGNSWALPEQLSFYSCSRSTAKILHFSMQASSVE